MPICLPSASMLRETFTGKPVTVMGWGKTSDRGGVSREEDRTHKCSRVNFRPDLSAEKSENDRPSFFTYFRHTSFVGSIENEVTYQRDGFPVV